MFSFTSLVLAASLVSSALAQQNFTVKVGADGFTFTPNQVTANAGDAIIFEFHPKNHSLTQSTLANPCSPVAGGGDSDYQPVAVGSTQFPTKRLTVPDATTPLWFYCKQAGHCQQGMVFAVNPGSAEKMQTFINNAKASGGATAGTPGTTTPGTTTPGTTEPGSTTPGTTTPGSTVPGSTTPGSTTPGSTTPGSTVPGSTTPGSTGTPQMITVQVGMGGTVYTPNQVNANPGDTLVFEFVGGNHTATQSTFADPCTPMAGGADSGFNMMGSPNFTVPVTGTNPMWFFCKQMGHCNKGMVFAVNAPQTGNTFSAYQAAAMTAIPGSTTGATDPNAAAPGGNSAAVSITPALSGLLIAGAIAGLLL